MIGFRGVKDVHPSLISLISIDIWFSKEIKYA